VSMAAIPFADRSRRRLREIWDSDFLYELRRETVMREARAFFFGGLDTTSTEVVVAVATGFGSQENAWFHQVSSYWEMAASFVNRGVLSPELFADNCGEGLFVFERMRPHLEALRGRIAPTFLSQMEKVVADHEVVRQRLEGIRVLLERIASR